MYKCYSFCDYALYKFKIDIYIYIVTTATTITTFLQTSKATVTARLRYHHEKMYPH